jgi:glutathione S-transferase
MKLYYSPGSCALGVHVLLEEIGAPFELRRVNFAEREQHGAAYVAINPKSKVPALERDDGSVMTEYQAISIYLALTHPEKQLIPSDIERQARMMEAMDYVVGTVHGQGFRQAFRALEYALREADQDAVKARGVKIADKGLALIDKSLAGKDWIVGEFSLADPALFYVSYWAQVRLKTGLPANVEKHFERMMDRGAVRKALKDEGL